MFNFYRVLIWGGTKECYTRNTNNLRAGPERTLTILEETLKCSVIHVNLENWCKFNDSEKIPYLMQKLKEKLNLDINILESAV